MSPPPARRPNVAASVRQRLLNLAHQLDADFQLVLSRFGAERFLYRLGQSRERGSLILKGAMLFRLWTTEEYRPTRDIDMLLRGPADHDAVRRAIEAICAVGCPEDGLTFEQGSISIATIRDAQEYGGFRVKLRAWLGETRIDLQIDIGSGDVVIPEPSEHDYPTLLDHPPPARPSSPRSSRPWCVLELQTHG